MSEDKFIGFMVSFDLGKRFKIKAYMTEDYYNEWKFLRDAAIKDVLVEDVELDLKKFLY